MDKATSIFEMGGINRSYVDNHYVSARSYKQMRAAVWQAMARSKQVMPYGTLDTLWNVALGTPVTRGETVSLQWA